jgi:endoglucanase
MTHQSEDAAPELVATLVELMELPGPTGQEEAVLSWCREHWRALGAEVQATPIGNVVAHVGGSGPRLLLQGHADEIGFVVKNIDKRGFVWLANGQAGDWGGIHHRYPVGQPALILGRHRMVSGRFASPTGHILSTRVEHRTRLDPEDLFVDVGADSRADAVALGVTIGAGVIWNPPTQRIGHRIVGKAIDDRVALTLMTHLLRRLEGVTPVYDVTIAATVQEEIGLVGAVSLARQGDFDLAIAIDNGPIGDYPGIESREMPVHLGEGPTLVYKDAMTHYDRRVINRLADVAESRGIPVQHGVFPGFGSDGAALLRGGIPTALLGLATRYTHSAFEMLDERDLAAALELLVAFVTSPPEPLPLGPA